MGDTMSALIRSAVEVMTQLPLHPLTLDMDAEGTRITAVMSDYALQTRSRGPYSPDNLPPEAMDMIDLVGLRWRGKPERPAFTIGGGGRWPVLLLTLPASRVQVRYVVPEDAPPVHQPDPGNATLSGDLRLMLTYLAESLRTAGGDIQEEPPVTVTLSYPDDPRYEEYTAGLTADVLDAVPPVVAAFELDRGRCTREQRAAHDDALRALAHDGQAVEPLGRTGFTTRMGWACLRDSGG